MFAMWLQSGLSGLGSMGSPCAADPVFRGALFFDDCAKPEEAEKVAGDAGPVEDWRPRDDEWRSARHGVVSEGRCCGAEGSAGWREAGVRQERDCRGNYGRTDCLRGSSWFGFVTEVQM